MKILHVYKTFLGDAFGGVERVIAQIVRNPQSNFHHTILSLSPDPEPKELEYLGIKIIRYKESLNIASNSISFSLLKDFRKIAQQADVIHYHFPWPFADVLHLFSRTQKPAIVTYHSDIVRQKFLFYLYRPLMHHFLKSIDTIVATSPNYFSTSPVLQKFREKVTVIPIGLNKTNYSMVTDARQAYWRNLYGDKFFLFIGVMRYYKGLHILLEAAQGTSFPILIVGSGPIEEELKMQAKELGLTNIHFLGRLAEEDKIALLQLCLSVIFPSHLRSEAFGVSLLEGAMFGKSLISSEIGTGTSYINVDGETGLVVPPGDSLALRNAMQFIWDNPDKATVMGEKAAERYWSLFTADKMVAEYERLYRGIANKKQGDSMLVNKDSMTNQNV
ncbi:glycosyltransferase family 4 protein [Legionella maceachernii]|uniref:Glycosyltransferase, lipopolysaccharide biosynthesis protein n=2 Tax=Legionella TaxID=445 RepID=A0A0W0WCU0_9GAMM|nr:glycosyltransferase family 4 protein [Legionella maceachernii]KTD30167.1 glycosyltransferase, lipopolysaccharide biosynthesis protein [Legionella maceachernii]SJZ93206.1 rhamnosyl/mannosyltransferase [Legionella maceachernii]SUP03468.1 Glycogen synthase [Legionella maceachernii]